MSATNNTNGAPVTIGSMTLNGVTEVTDRGGVNAPEKDTERGFSWSSYVDSKPIQADVQAMVAADQYNRLTQLRDEETPVAVSIGQVTLELAVVQDLEVTNTSQTKSHYEVSFSIREVREVTTDTTTVTVNTGNGQASGSATTERPSFVQSEEDSSGAGEDVEESGGGGGGGNFVSDVIGGAADALGGLF